MNKRVTSGKDTRRKHSEEEHEAQPYGTSHADSCPMGWGTAHSVQPGLVAVNRETQSRTPKPSARFLGDIAKRNAI